MSIRKRLRTIFVCLTLEAGALIGVPVRPEHIQELMRALNESQVAHTLPEEQRKADD